MQSDLDTVANRLDFLLSANSVEVALREYGLEKTSQALVNLYAEKSGRYRDIDLRDVGLVWPYDDIYTAHVRDGNVKEAVRRLILIEQSLAIPALRSLKR